MRGKSLATRARVPGRQAQIIATLHSIADQLAALVLSSVGLVFGLGWGWEAAYRLGLASWRLLAGFGGGGWLLSGRWGGLGFGLRSTEGGGRRTTRQARRYP